MRYNLSGAVLPDGKLITPNDKKTTCSFSHLEAFIKRKFIWGPPNHYVLLGRALPALAWAKSALLAQQGKEQEPRQAWATKNVLAPIAGSVGWISIAMHLPWAPQALVFLLHPPQLGTEPPVRHRSLGTSSCKQAVRTCSLNKQIAGCYCSKHNNILIFSC